MCDAYNKISACTCMNVCVCVCARVCVCVCVCVNIPEGKYFYEFVDESPRKVVIPSAILVHVCSNGCFHLHTFLQ